MDDIVPQLASHKQCSTCKVFKPATTEHFTLNKTAKDGLYSQCKICKSATRRSQYKPHPRPPVADTPKQCNKCLEWKPRTTEYFHKRGKYLVATCKDCLRKRPKYPETERICTVCNEKKPIESFRRHSERTASGYTTAKQCKECRYAVGNARQRVDRKENPEKYRERDRKRNPGRAAKFKERYNTDEAFRVEAQRKRRDYYKTHSEIIRQQAKATKKRHPETRKLWDAANPDKVRKHKRDAYYREDPEVRREKNRLWRKNQAERIRANNRNRKARLKGAGGKFTQQDIFRQYKAQKGKCYYCRKKLTTYHIDHIVPITKGGTNDPWNLVVACPTCNIKKHNKLLHEWTEGGRLL